MREDIEPFPDVERCRLEGAAGAGPPVLPADPSGGRQASQVPEGGGLRGVGTSCSGNVELGMGIV